MVKGKIGYLPKICMTEIENLKNELGFDKDGDALKAMANRSIIFRELKFNIKRR